jgi:hypothetical protein
MKRRAKAFSLLETMVVVSLSAIIMALGASSLRDGRSHASAAGLATVVAEELARCRQEAIVHRRPVAFVVPSNSGATASSEGFFVLEGESSPVITRRRSFSQDFRGSRLVVASWASAGTWSLMGAATGSKWSAFNPNDWLPTAYGKNYAYIFMPDGTLRTNDLPSLDNAYPIVVASGATVGGSSAPSGTSVMSTPPNYFSITSAGDVQTLFVNSAGFVRRSGGLEGSSGITGKPATFNQAAAAPLALTTVVSSAPELVGQPLITPDQDPNLMPPNTDAVLSKDNFLSLETRAISLTGDQLYCNWTVTPDPSNSVPSAKGIFSMPGSGGRMEWDANLDDGHGKKGAWRSVWQWRPPANAKPKDRFALQAEVQDLTGSQPQTAQIKHIEVEPPGKVLFETNRSGSWEVWSMDRWGGSPKVYVKGARQAHANREGTRVVYVKGGNIFLAYPQDPAAQHVKLTNYTSAPYASIPCLSPNGNLVAYRLGDDIKVARAFLPSTPVQVDNAPPPTSFALPPENEKMCWNPSGDTLVYGKNDRLWASSVVATGSGPVVSDARLYINTHQAIEVPLCSPSWSTTGQIYYENNFFQPTYDPYLFRATAGPATPGSSATGFNWWTSSYYVEQSTVECDPAGSSLVMETWAPCPAIGDREIVLYDTAPIGIGTDPTASAAIRHICRTPGFSNMRPTWMK